jgi:COP9 signalosome complex subunit 3
LPDTAPAQAASAIAVEAYKKFVLVGLINWGKPALTPKNMSSHVIRALASMCKPYQKIAEAFSKYNRAELAKAIAQSRKLLTDDSNMGLAQVC